MRVISAKSYGFKGPAEITFGNSRVRIANGMDNSVTELNAKDGSLVRVISGQVGSFDGPESRVLIGTHFWVSSVYGNSVSEFSATNGPLIRIIKV